MVNAAQRLIDSYTRNAQFMFGFDRAARRHRRHYGHHFAPNGERERTRRLRQIANGRLTAANGLILSSANDEKPGHLTPTSGD